MTEPLDPSPEAAPARAGTLRSVIRYTVSGVITLFFLYLAFRGTNFKDLYASILRANYWWMIPNFCCLMVSHYLRAWRWRYMLEPVKPNLSMRSLFSGVMVGYMMNNVLPRAGELVRPYTLGKLEHVPKSAAFGTIIVERIMDMVSFLVLVALIPLVYDGPLVESFPWLMDAGVVISVITIAMLAFFVALAVRRDWADGVVQKVERILPERFGQRLEGIVHSFLDGFMFLGRPGRFTIIIVLSVLIWLLYILMMYAAFFAFNLDHLGLAGALVVQAISSIGVALPTPGGTGTYHAFTSQTLSRLYSVDATTALSFATVTHAVGFIGVTLVGLAYFLRDHIRVGEAVRTEGQDAE